MDKSINTKKAQQGVVDNWQGGKSLAECNRHMLNSEDACDVSFRVRGEGQVIKAHRYVLISRSCVFYSMFTGPLAETSEVRITDVDSKDFKAFLTYLYTDETTVDADNVTALLYMARKYAVTGLEIQCQAFLANNLIVENACTVLEAADRFDEKELYEKAFNLILEGGNQALESPGFLEVSRDQVNKISESEELNADEEVLFVSVNKWAESECKRQSLEISPNNKRSVLGDVVKNIRFSLMELMFVATVVKGSDLLSDSERVGVFDNIATGKSHPRSRRQRSNVMTVIRFSSCDGEWDCFGETEAIDFTCNTNIKLLGLKLFGAYEGRGTYTVTCYFESECSNDSEIKPATEYADVEETYEVLFPDPLDVVAGTWYTVSVEIDGPPSHRGVDGTNWIECENGVEFNFRNSNGSTLLEEGQIPSLIYEIANVRKTISSQKCKIFPGWTRSNFPS